MRSVIRILIFITLASLVLISFFHLLIINDQPLLKPYHSDMFWRNRLGVLMKYLKKPITIVKKTLNLNASERYITGRFDISPGLGNQMFVYASLKSIAIRYGAQVIIPEDSGLRRAFKLDAIFVTNKVFRKLRELHKGHIHYFSMCCTFYDVEKLNLFADRNLEVIDGYLQSFRYFHPHLSSLIRSEFTFIPEIITRAKDHLAETKALTMLGSNGITNEKDYEIPQTYVGVHIRHGADITNQNQNVRHGHKAATSEYIIHAMNYFRTLYRNVLFVIISDNHDWVRSLFGMADESQFMLSNSTILFHEYPSFNDTFLITTESRETDMATLTLCNHTIMSTGTFSWWTAYLTGGITTYYSDWPRAGSDMEKLVKKADFFPKKWIPMT